jgi:CDP-glycerol glycerophosphotransferase (TagB/SpsB family)
MMDLIKSFDALITDYSSIYHEYLLLNRPIALTIDDYEEYSAGTGFSIDYFEWIKGVYLTDVSNLMRFVDEVSENIDSAKNERNLALHRIHAFVDNQSTKRVVDFLAEKIPL